jgi:hypothetical protein
MKSVELSPELADLAEWMQKQAERDDYGELHVVVKIDRGRIAFIERSYVEKLKFSGQPGGSRHGTR